MINSKLTKQVDKQTSEEKLFKLLESIDWKLWEMYNMMKEVTGKDAAKKPIKKSDQE
jgi:hypothetical protein